VTTTAFQCENVQRTVSAKRRIPVRFLWVDAGDGTREEAGEFIEPGFGGEAISGRREGGVVWHGSGPLDAVCSVVVG
jgi:hypothetical protein